MQSVDEQAGVAEGEVGYGKPPLSTRFQKGRSGNPRGRPKNRRREIPYDHILGQMVTIREDGRTRRVTAAEAFILQLTRKGLQGDSAAARASLAAIEEARAKRQVDSETVSCIVWKIVSPGSVGFALDALSMAVKHRKYTPDAKYLLKPWLVDLALARLGERRLSAEERNVVAQATWQPDKISWPDSPVTNPKGD